MIPFLFIPAVLLGVYLNNPDTFNTPESSVLSYQKDILPILENRCALCHDANSPGKNWLDYDTTFKKRLVIKQRLENKTMPPDGFEFSEKERKMIIQWIDSGAQK